jgi:hypothetical protein
MSWLHNKRPIVISADLALHVGLNEAIVLQQLNYWLESTDSGVDHEGARWVYNTHEQWRDQFPFWSVDTVKRTFTSLKKQDLNLIAQLSKDKHDRTNYYTVNHAKLDEMYAAARSFPHQCKMPSSKSAKSADGKVQTAPVQECSLPSSIGATCPDVHTEITTETTPESLAEGAAAPTQAVAVIAEPSSVPRRPLPADMPGPKDPECKTFKAWANYACAYRNRYQAWPVWNAKAGGQLGQLIARLGIESAHHVAAFYLTVNDAFLIRKCHDLASLVRDAESFHTQWTTGRQVNGRVAKQIEDRQANLVAGEDAARRIMERRTQGGERNEFL